MRVHTGHSGDRDGRKGACVINMVDEVTQFPRDTATRFPEGVREEASDLDPGHGPAPEGSRNGLGSASAAFVPDGRIETAGGWKS